VSVGRPAQSSCTESDPLNPPACAPQTIDHQKVTITPPGKINWGIGISADTTNFFDAIGKTITFDANTSPSNIILQSNAVINAHQ